jgi:flavin reductase (DIM6/NTAB) family NADH-FMN oxidoreductase RutF
MEQLGVECAQRTPEHSHAVNPMSREPKGYSMPADSAAPIGEMLRVAMRSWVTGVSIVTSRFEEAVHGMTVNSFGSISLDPPLVTVTMNHDTRTYALVQRSGIFGVTVLSSAQQHLAERFAGRVPDGGDRLAGLEAFPLLTGAPFLRGGLAFIDCRVVHQYPMQRSTLLIGEVAAVEYVPSAVAAALLDEMSADLLDSAPGPLIYYKRTFFKLD